uniref:Uncharacterized protein n=1 Tax=Trichuris muris TaxID=70415 RepID=A0A5S6QYW4_TRIMR
MKMNYSGAWPIVISFLLLVPATDARDGCQLYVCPFDCATTILPNETCPKCFCQPGARCPFVTCPTELSCSQKQSADGCLHCICRHGIYETYSTRKHQISYTSKPLGTHVKEACSKMDDERVRRCASNVTSLLESEAELDSRLATTPEIASFLVPHDRLNHICETKRALRECIPVGPWLRCADAIPVVRHVDALFKVVCRWFADRPITFETHYTCLRNVLPAHVDCTYCLDRYRHEVRHRAVNSPFVRRASRVHRCNAAENLVVCVKGPLTEKCSVDAARLWQEAFVSVASVIAPECLFRQGHFAAKEYKTDGFSSPLQIFFPLDMAEQNLGVK